MSNEDTGKTCCFDYSHNNTLTIENPSNSDFIQYLFGSSIRLGKIQAGFTSLDKLEKYRMVVIGGPREGIIEIEEIKNLEQYVKNGGNLLIINDEGGDYSANINLSELTQKFGFLYNPDIIGDSMYYHGIQSRVIPQHYEPHPATRNVDQIVLSNPCSIHINELIEGDENVNILPLITTGLNSYHKRWDGENWIEEEDAPKSILAVAVNYYKGRVIGLTSISMFSSLSSAYGFNALDNHKLIASIFGWLLEPPKDSAGAARDEKLITVSINYNIFAWMEKLILDKKWQNPNDIINFTLKYFKDNYDQVLKSIEERKARLKHEREKEIERIQKIEDEKERKRQAILFEAEQNILNLTDKNSEANKDLEGIMKSLQNVTRGQVGKEIDPRVSQPGEQKGAESKSEEPKQETNTSKEKPKELEIPKEILVSDKEITPEKKLIEEATKDIMDPDKLAKEISQEIQQKLEEAPKLQINEEKPASKPEKSEADKELDSALKALGSFDDFSKKLDEFKETQKTTEPPKDKQKKIDDKDIFE